MNRKRCKGQPRKGEEGAVTKVEPNRNHTGRTMSMESVGSMRKEGNPMNSLVRSASFMGNDTKGRGVRNLSYQENLKREKKGVVSDAGGSFTLVTTILNVVWG